MLRIIKWTIPRRNLALTSFLNVTDQNGSELKLDKKRRSFTTVHQRAEALKYIDELAKNRVGKFTLADKANAISEHFYFAVSRQNVYDWNKNRDVIFANAERFEPSSESTPTQSKLAVSLEQIDFEIELCSILYSELDRRNLSMGFIIQQAKLLANDKYPTLKHIGGSDQQGKFNEKYCYAMLLRNGWKWPAHDFYLEYVSTSGDDTTSTHGEYDDDEDSENQEVEFYIDKNKKIFKKKLQRTRDRKEKFRSRKFAIPQRRYIGYVQNGLIVGNEPMSIPGEPDHVPFLIKEDDTVMIPATNVAQFKDGTKVSFFVAVSKDEETKVARRIEAFSEN